MQYFLGGWVSGLAWTKLCLTMMQTLGVQSSDFKEEVEVSCKWRIWRSLVQYKKCKMCVELLCTASTWYIWTARCSKVFDNVESGKIFGCRLCIPCRAQYEASKGGTDAAVRQHLTLISQWKMSPFFILRQWHPHVAIQASAVDIPSFLF